MMMKKFIHMLFDIIDNTNYKCAGEYGPPRKLEKAYGWGPLEAQKITSGDGTRIGTLQKRRRRKTEQ